MTPFGDEELVMYVMENVPETHRKALSDRSNMLYAHSFQDTLNNGENYCVARVGLTSPTRVVGLQPRGPRETFTGGFKSEVDGKLSDEQRTLCHSVALKSAVASLGEAKIEEVLRDIERTRSTGGRRVQEGADTSRAQVDSGLASPGKDRFFDAVPASFRRTFDYRQVQWDVSSNWLTFKDGTGYCFAMVGVTARAPADRETRHPSTIQRAVKKVAPEQANLPGAAQACRAEAAVNAVKVLLSKSWDEAGLFKDFEKTKEEGVPLPGYADRLVKQPVLSTPPLAPVRTTNAPRTNTADTCEVNCRNGDCVRRWPNGKSERFQAVRKLNVFGQWEWDTGGC